MVILLGGMKMVALGFVLTFISGLGIGLIHKGIHIHVHKDLPQTKKEGYNESMAHLLPASVQQYYESTKGQNNW
jgi:hypothetical protein